MKERSMSGLMVSLVVLGTVLLPASAQSRSERYPTNTEIQRLIREFRQQASTPLPEGSICCRGSRSSFSGNKTTQRLLCESMVTSES